MDEVKAAVCGHALRELLGGGEVVAGVNCAGGLGVGIADINDPDGDLVSVLVLLGLWAVEIHGAIKSGVRKLGGGDGHNG